MKRFLAIMMCLVMVLAVVGCAKTATTEAPKTEAKTETQAENPASKVEVGIILVGDENEGYTYAHIEGIRTALKNVGIDEATQTIWKWKWVQRLATARS